MDFIGNISQAHNAYSQAARRLGNNEGDTASSGNSVSDFGSVLHQAVNGVVESGHEAERQAAQGIKGGGDMTQIVTAVSNAQLALQTTTVLRDRFVQAYQDVMRMSI
ncbi:flagellar hook-basal body complex protein FliE [Kozakia baliensis]|uniref:Flagellar hook-basal body complex protein FliE n=1 Tax=Kozakia baliensis TaxID=153496 RepID=A0A1D8UQF8_9PROT|nr:flagellar hook-basal body complex protein FliE [Kozakia baliensis]AOX15880.1 flagellar hook-basal body protein FliE [Kozakia baliensis]GBR27689.1 flagellar hook-basal body protein FleE [Kozakia baliensis NRIC 0488]GEL64241.1 hypothetical protein KBA01_15270 [Kozakia baliensis]